jgi:hypothetical protein
MTKEDKERIEKEAYEYDHGPDDGTESPYYFYGHTAGYIDGATSENERLSAEIQELKDFVRDVDRSLYHGPDLSDPEIMQHYISVFEIIKKDAKDLLGE